MSCMHHYLRQVAPCLDTSYASYVERKFLCHAACPQANDACAWGTPKPTTTSQPNIATNSAMKDADGGAEPDEADPYDMSLLIFGPHAGGEHCDRMLPFKQADSAHISMSMAQAPLLPEWQRSSCCTHDGCWHLSSELSLMHLVFDAVNAGMEGDGEDEEEEELTVKSSVTVAQLKVCCCSATSEGFPHCSAAFGFYDVHWRPQEPA